MASKIEEVESDPFVPVFARNRKGMVAGDPLAEEEQAEAESSWNEARKCSLLAAKYLSGLGVAKQWANRLLEPFAYVKVLVTATDWKNFLRLRCADDAQPEMQELAVAIRQAVNASTPRVVGKNEWHLPYVNVLDDCRSGLAGPGGWKKVSAARCARVSYTTHDGKRDTTIDLSLFETLRADGHSSPLEHQLIPARDRRKYGNVRGWISQRYLLEQSGELPDPEG